MNELYIRLKNLRIERGLTQTDVAQALNITTQAVSKWESQASYPDISQLIPLADFYGVTVDYLLGHDPNTAETEICNYIENCENRFFYRKPEEWNEAVEETRHMLRKYPKEYRLMAQLCSELYMMYSRDKRACCLAEISDYGERILRECTDSRIRHQAVKWLIGAYHELELYDKARNLADEMPDLSLSRELLYYLCSDFGTEKHLYDSQVAAYKCFVELFGTIKKYITKGDCSLLSTEEKISLCKTLVELVNAYYPNGDYECYMAADLYITELHAAKYCADLSQIEEALSHMKSAVEYLSEAKNITENEFHSPFTSPFARLLDVRAVNFQKTYYAKHFEKITGQSVFDDLRNSDEYIEIKEKAMSILG